MLKLFMNNTNLLKKYVKVRANVTNFFAVCSHCKKVKALDNGIGISEYQIQSRYYIHFRKNNLWESMNHLVFAAMD